MSGLTPPCDATLLVAEDLHQEILQTVLSKHAASATGA